MMEILDREKLMKYQQKYECNQDSNLNLLSKTSIKWVELLENEFDKRFLELDSFFNQLIDSSNENSDHNSSNARSTLNEISSVFAQLAHKCLVVFDQNTKLEKDLDNCKRELKFVRSERKLLERKLQDNQTKQQNELIDFNSYNSSNRHSMNSTRLSNRVMSLSNVSRSSSLFNIKCNYPQSNESNYSEVYADEEIRNLREDNLSLKKLNISLKSELFGCRLTIKYLNKELTGRIQQIQILSKSDLQDRSRLFNQIETEIHLSQSKTVIKACRDREQILFGTKPSRPDLCDYHKKNGIGEIRRIRVEKAKNEGLGISITGGKEYGIPIIISEIYRNTPASRCGKLYIGDSILSVNNIDLNDLKHSDAAQILLNQSDLIDLECVFILPDLDENETNHEQDSCSSRYCYFDSRVMYNNENQNDLNQEQTSNKANDLIELKRSIDSDEDDNISSITNTFSSPNKFPGCAKPLSSLFTATSRNLIKEEEDEILEVADENYDKIKLQTLDGNRCQIFYKNKSTIIN